MDFEFIGSILAIAGWVVGGLLYVFHISRKFGRVEERIGNALESIEVFHESYGRWLGMMVRYRLVDPGDVDQLNEPFRRHVQKAVTRLKDSIEPAGNPITKEQAERMRELLAKLERKEALSAAEANELSTLVQILRTEKGLTSDISRLQDFLRFIRGEMDVLEKLRADCVLQLDLLWQEIEREAKDLNVKARRQLKIVKDGIQSFQVDALVLSQAGEAVLRPEAIGYIAAGGVISNGRTIRVDWSVDIEKTGVKSLRNYTQLVSFRDENEKFNWVVVEDLGEHTFLSQSYEERLRKPRFRHYRFEARAFLQDLFSLTSDPQLQRLILYPWET